VKVILCETVKSGSSLSDKGFPRQSDLSPVEG